MVIIESEDVKQAIVERLLEVFPDVAVYKEANTNVTYPHFFVDQMNVVDVGERKDYHLLYYYMEIRYRNVADPSTDLSLRNHLDEIGLKLLQNFNIINLEDEKVRCTDKSYEKNEGVLQFYVTIQIMAKELSSDEYEKQNTLDIEIELDKE